MPDSRLSVGASPAPLIIAAWTGSSCQSLFENRSVPLPLCSSSVGLASASRYAKGSQARPDSAHDNAVSTAIASQDEARDHDVGTRVDKGPRANVTQLRGYCLIEVVSFNQRDPRGVILPAHNRRIRSGIAASATIADSRLSVGGMPVAIISASWVSLQLSLVSVIKPAGPCSSITGSASASGTPKRCQGRSNAPQEHTFGNASRDDESADANISTSLNSQAGREVEELSPPAFA